jgi:hypothetical protein
MPNTVMLKTFFRSDRARGRETWPERYFAGFESEDGEQWGMSVPLEAEEVEAEVLKGIALSLSSEANGTLQIEAEGRGDNVNEVISSSAARSPLDVLIKNALQPDLLSMEDDPLEELRVLQRRLSNALSLVEQAMANYER